MLADRDVRADDEHQQREADVGEEDERRLGRVERAACRCAPIATPAAISPMTIGGAKRLGSSASSGPSSPTATIERERPEAQNTPASRPAAIVRPSSWAACEVVGARRRR